MTDVVIELFNDRILSNVRQKLDVNIITVGLSDFTIPFENVTLSTIIHSSHDITHSGIYNNRQCCVRIIDVPMSDREKVALVMHLSLIKSIRHQSIAEFHGFGSKLADSKLQVLNQLS